MFGLFLFLFWELPAMVAMSAHKAICAATDGSFADQFLGTWSYRAIGVFIVWPVALALLSGAYAIGGGGSATFVGLAFGGLIVWARVSSSGA